MYGQHATDIVGYTFNADIYCPEHTLTAVKATYPLDYPLAGTIQDTDTTDDILRTVAKSLRLGGHSIDPTDESSYDSDEFPKVIFADSAWDVASQGHPEHCAVCHSPLVES